MKNRNSNLEITQSKLTNKTVLKNISGTIFSNMETSANDAGALWTVFLKNGDVVRFGIRSDGSVAIQRFHNNTWLPETPLVTKW